MINPLNFGIRRKLPLVLQSDITSCGETCLAMICGYFGQKLTASFIREHCHIGNQGTTLSVLMQAAGILRFSCRALRCKTNELNRFDTPIILHWDFNHYVVLKASRADKFIIHDPAIGECRYSKVEMDDHFTGVALELTPSDQTNQILRSLEEANIPTSTSTSHTPTMPTLRMFLQGIIGLGPILSQILVLSLVLQVFALSMPFYTQLIIDEVLAKKNEDLLTTLFVGFSLVAFVSVVTQTLRGWIGIYLSHQLSYALSSNLFLRVIQLPEIFFHNRHMGDIVSRFGSLQAIQSFITSSFITVLLDGLMAITTLVVITLYSSFLAVLVVVTVAIRLVVDLCFFSTIKKRQNQHLIAAARLESNFMEAIRSIVPIKRFGIEASKSNEWLNKLVDSINTNIRLDRTDLALTTSTMLIQSLGAVVIIYAGATEVINGKMSIGMLIAFLAYRSHLDNALGSLVGEFVNYLMLSLHFERLSDFYAYDTLPDQSATKTINDISTITLTRIGYQYSHASAWIFRDINLRINRGEHIAIYGSSGTGKSTFLRIITDSLTPQCGEIFFDGTPIRLISKQSKTMLIASVMQDDQLFSGSLKDNITLSVAASTQDLNPAPHTDIDAEPFARESVGISNLANWQQMEKAAQHAEIHEHILTLPLGYETPVGEMGTTLSTGQIQRILLARALYREPKLLILDEGTAHLDDVTAVRIFDNIRRLGTTVLYVTHNRQLLSKADRILVMKMSPRGEYQLIPHKIVDTQS